MVWPSCVYCSRYWKLTATVVLMELRIRAINRKSKIKCLFIMFVVHFEKIAVHCKFLLLQTSYGLHAPLWRPDSKLRTDDPHRKASLNVSHDPLTNSWLPTYTSPQEIGAHRGSFNKQKIYFDVCTVHLVLFIIQINKCTGTTYKYQQYLIYRNYAYIWIIFGESCASFC
jgi:hypothetical protein